MAFRRVCIERRARISFLTALLNRVVNEPESSSLFEMSKLLLKLEKLIADNPKVLVGEQLLTALTLHRDNKLKFVFDGPEKFEAIFSDTSLTNTEIEIFRMLYKQTPNYFDDWKRVYRRFAEANTCLASFERRRSSLRK